MPSTYMRSLMMLFLACALSLMAVARGFVTPTQFPQYGGVGLSRQSLSTVQMATAMSASSFSSDDSFDMDELQQRIAQEYAPQIPIAATTAATNAAEIPHAPTTVTVFHAAEHHQIIETVHIIVFPEHDGAHTIEYPKGSGNNILLAFESEAACEKFAQSLKAQHFFNPTPQSVQLTDVRKLCDGLGVFVQVVSKEAGELKPPSQNVQQFGHNPSLCQTKKHLDYLFSMTMDDEDVEESGLLHHALDEDNDNTVFSDNSAAWDDHYYLPEGDWE